MRTNLRYNLLDKLLSITDNRVLQQIHDLIDTVDLEKTDIKVTDAQKQMLMDSEEFHAKRQRSKGAKEQRGKEKHNLRLNFLAPLREILPREQRCKDDDIRNGKIIVDESLNDEEKKWLNS